MHLPLRRPATLVFALAAAFALPSVPDAEGQSGPRWRYLQGGNNYGIAFIDSNQGIVTRDGGGALYSDDGGLTWEEAVVDDAVRG